MADALNHQIEVNKLIASIEQDTGIDIKGLKNHGDILLKINQYVKNKETKIRSIEENKKTIISSILKEKKYLEKHKIVLKRHFRKKKKTSILKIASETGATIAEEGSSTQLTQAASSSVLDNVEAKTISEDDVKPKRKISNKVNRRKSRKSEPLEKQSNDLEEKRVVIKPAKSAREACKDILRHIAEVDQAQLATTGTNALMYDAIKYGMERSYCIRDWREVFFSKPENFNFYDFVNGNTYKKLVKLTNKTMKVVTCRFHSVYYPDCLHMDSDLMGVDFKNDVKLYPGLSFQFNITFCPKTLENDFKVELIFVANINNYMAFLPIPVEGILTDSLIVVEPLTVDFGLRPVWPVKDKSKKHRKEIIITCSGRRPIELYIKKCDDVAQTYKPYSTPEDSGHSSKTLKSKTSTISTNNQNTNRSESDLCGSDSEVIVNEELSKTTISVSEILEECIGLAIDVFYFEKRHITLQPNRQNKVYVWFKNAKNLGFHQGQFNFEFYKYSNKATDQTTLTLFTKKKITLFSETYDLPLVITPTTLDLTSTKKTLGCMSSSFAIYNSHKNLSTYVEIVETKLLKHTISITPDNVFIQPMKLQKFSISYTAKNKSEEDILRDSVVNICVSIIAKIKSEKYHMAPPLHIQIYAPYNI